MFGYEHANSSIWVNWGGAKKKLLILVSQSYHKTNLWQNTKFLHFLTYCLSQNAIIFYTCICQSEGS